MTDYISRADAICEVLVNDGIDNIVDRINALPSAETVSREEYEETDGVVTIEKQNANEVGEIKHIVIHSPNYTRYFYNESMPLPSADAVQGEWIPCNEKMPKELERVNVTWLNHNPPFYYQHIKDIPQTDTAVYYRGKWYWWDVTVIDVLAEYGENCNAEQIDKDIEVVAWMPLPTPYKGGDDE